MDALGASPYTSGVEPARRAERPGLAPPREAGLLRLAQRLGELPVGTPLVVHLTEGEPLLALSQHVERQLGAWSGRPVVRAAVVVDSGWLDLAQRLGVELAREEPAEAARLLAERAAALGVGLVVPMASPSRWDLACALALASGPLRSPLVLVVPAPRVELAALPQVEVSATLTQEELSHWWQVALTAAPLAEAPALGALEARLRAVRWAAERAQLEPVPLGEGERRLLARLALSRRSWPLAQLRLLDDGAAVDGLVARGALEHAAGLLSLAAPWAELPLEEARHVAVALLAAFPQDPWASLRAAELWALAGDAEAAEHAAQRGLSLVHDASSRPELWQRWEAVVASFPEAGPVRLRGAELALQLGDADVALDWAQRAAGAVEPARAALLLGRAALARGDLVTAYAALEQSRRLARGAEERWEATVELAEVSYTRGELERAQSLADEVAASARSARVRLAARNLLGKLLLAQGQWESADAHFAQDVCDAVLEKEDLAELRARINRAIALLSGGNHEQARPILDAVLVDAEQRGERRAVGFALSNLAVLALERHAYAQALAYSERAIEVRRGLGDRLGFARDVVNLVELRLRLGLVAEAEQALRFGRQALGPGSPASRLSEVALVAARVHLARGQHLEAERELRLAHQSAGRASDGDKLGDCHRLAARLAIEEGALTRAASELEQARAQPNTALSRAEIALLEALLARARGDRGAQRALQAVHACRESGDEDLLRDAHTLTAEIYLAEGEEETARSHLRAALALRDELLAQLPVELHDSYLGRAELRALARLELARLEPAPEAPPPSTPPERQGGLERGTGRFLGQHPAVRALLASVRRVGRGSATVLLSGESGTGKELLAEALHAASERAAGPLVKVNCAALVESLLLSELFGHEKGAFTGATARRRGRFERASGGTLFLDEIGDISPRTQVALLRVLEERTIERVGGGAPIPVDVRIVCATHRNLKELVERGEFRRDLYYRLSAIVLSVPPLRERLSDLPLLCEGILRRVAEERGEPPKRLSPEALQLLARHRWPGNVRELDNVLRLAALFTDTEVIDRAALWEHVEALRLAEESAAVGEGPMRGAAREAQGPSEATSSLSAAAYGKIREHAVSLGELKRALERDCITQALTEAGGNITRAAALLGMKRPRLSQLVKQHGLLVGLEEDPER